MTCIRCKKNEQSPGAEPYCGSCWAKNPDSSTMDWPSYSESAVAMLVTGKRAESVTGNCMHCQAIINKLIFVQIVMNKGANYEQ